MPKNISTFSLKFIDIMVSVVFGLGFQWWPSLQEPWQYIAFIFVYVDIIDYWIDYSPSLKKFPPKREYDLILDVMIMFSLFLYIFSTQKTVVYFLTSFVLWRTLDFIWLLRARWEYRPAGRESMFIKTWLMTNALEVATGLLLIGLACVVQSSSLVIISVFICTRLLFRLFASLKYKSIYFS